MKTLALLAMLLAYACGEAADDKGAAPIDEDADTKFERLLSEAVFNLEQSGRPLKALELLKDALLIKPEDGNLYGTMAIAQAESNLLEEAIVSFDKAASLTEGNTKAGIFYNKGMVMLNRKKHEEALVAFKSATEADPGFFPAYVKSAQAYREMGDLPNAIIYLEKASTIRPEEGSTFLYLADSYNDLKHFDKAAVHYREALRLTPPGPPGNPAAVVGLADTLANQKKYNEAMEELDRHAVSSGNPDVLRALVRCKRTLSEWSNWGPMLHGLFKSADLGLQENAGPSFLQPYQTLYLPTNPGFQQAIARTHAVAVQMTRRPAPPAWTKNFITTTKDSEGKDIEIVVFDADRTGRPLKIGYLSRRFENYPGTQLMLRIFGLHDRSKFKVYCYANGPPNESEERKTLEKDCDVFNDISMFNLEEATNAIVQDNIDILVDYDGHHSFNSLQLLTQKPAPILVTWLGFAGTTGMDNTIDYIIADPFVIKENEVVHYSEKVVFMPVTYQPQDHLQPIAETPSDRSEVGLPNDAFVFACFNRNDKIEPDVWKIWMEILRRVEKSVLWLYEDDVDGVAGSNLMAAAEKDGIERERIVFAKRLPKPQHLARHKLADLFLDTFYYGAHTTASDALWAGLPVLTSPGATFSSRVSGSLLKAAGMDELIVDGPEKYIEKAVELATNPTKLKEVKDKLLANRPPVKPLFDTPQFVKDLEAAFEAMWAEKTTLCQDKKDMPADYVGCWSQSAKFLSSSPAAFLSVAPPATK
eukprot:gb/GEZN01001931.1/.p1 GENE.gb/GEZN01001931.1/~~gb/GEZN01001931.1/.p1  ORF type:complete len:758 (-),score=109.09 gb/GEZN01001931.1/:364-2637(-)